MLADTVKMVEGRDWSEREIREEEERREVVTVAIEVRAIAIICCLVTGHG